MATAEEEVEDKEPTFRDDLRDDCSQFVLADLGKQLQEVKYDIYKYKERVEKLDERIDASIEEPTEDLEAEIEALRHEEAQLSSRLLQTEAKHKQLLTRAEKCRKEAPAGEVADRLENDAGNEEARKEELVQEVKDLDFQLGLAAARLEKLSKTSIFDLFEVDYSDTIGRIGGHRLGRLPEEPVDWNEIHTAFGQLSLLLSSLGRALGVKFVEHEPVPFGVRSYMQCLDGERKKYPLYNVDCAFYNHQFNQALTALAGCVAQVHTKATKLSPESIGNPWRISRGNILHCRKREGYCIRYHMNSEAAWTAALRSVLIVLSETFPVAQARIDRLRAARRDSRCRFTPTDSAQ